MSNGDALQSEHSLSFLRRRDLGTVFNDEDVQSRKQAIQGLGLGKILPEASSRKCSEQVPSVACVSVVSEKESKEKPCYNSSEDEAI